MKLLQKIYVSFFLLSFFAYNKSIAQADTAILAKDTLISVDTSIKKNAGYDTSDLGQQKLKLRRSIVGFGSIGIYGGMLYGLNKAWYSKYPRASFHFYNDNGEWNQVDKVGHAWSVYQLTGATYHAWKWAGASDKKAFLLSGISGPGFLTVIEILDGFSNKWGFSWGDMRANVLGSGMFIGQQSLWNEQRISFKFLFHKNSYTDAMLESRANSLFGNSWNERMLKDYNAQTYWLSGNLKSFFPQSRLPRWLNVAAGYGANGMFGGYRNEWNDNGKLITRHDVRRTRQFYIAPDVDLTKINTKSKFLKTAFYALNSLKFPAPALMIDNTGKLKAYLVYF